VTRYSGHNVAQASGTSARDETARIVVTAQMFLDLIALGLGLRIILNAVERGRQRLTNESGAEVTPE
jgi:hypothetical protein